MKSAIRMVPIMCLLALGVTSCSDTGGGGGYDAIPTVTVTGTVTLPPGTPIDPASLDVVSFADRAEVDADGGFSVLVPDADLPQVLLVMGDGTAPVLAGWLEPGDVDPVVIDATSTAVALGMMNPFLTMFSAENRATFETSMRQHNSWNTFVQAVGAAVAGSSVGRLSDDSEPALVQMAARIVLDRLAGNPGGELAYTWPWLEDADGSDVACMNPGAVFYGFRAVSADEEQSVTVLAGSDRDNIRVIQSWPPSVDPTTMTRTLVDLGEGTFDTRFSRADFRTFDAATPEGVAGVENCARGVVEMLAPLSGALVDGRASELGVASWPTSDLAAAAADHDTYGFMLALIELVRLEAGGVASWYWEDDNAACEDFIEAACPLVRGAVFATQVLAGGEDRVPFFGDLVTAGSLGAQRVRQLEGVMSLTSSQTAPRAAFVFSPPFATAGTAVAFDASACSDVDDAAGSLEVRWDWESDGVWDTDWSVARTAQHSFSFAGTQQVSVQVKDGEGLSDTAVRRVNVGGSQGTAAHVVILRDAVPWAPELPAVLDQMLEALGMTEGDGPGCYEVRRADEIASLSLTPGEDLVIVQNDQPQTFYNMYGRNQVKVLQFVAAGGSILWEACDLGWNGGSIQAARIVLPGNVELREYRAWLNNVALRGAPIVKGLPEQVYGQYASHEGIENLPDGATVYTRDNTGAPTLVEFGYGDGWVVLTTQPLEWNFYHNWTCGLVMPNVVCCVLGLPLVHDFGDIIKPEERGKPASVGGAQGLTSGKR